MLKPKRLFNFIIIFFLVQSVLLSQKCAARTINIAGMVVNSENLQPIESANIYDNANRLLGTTDSRGYYNIRFNVNDTGEVRFEIKIKRQGFKLLSDKEHWGDLNNGVNMIMYFGMQQAKSEAAAFSNLGANTNGDLSYENVLSDFKKVRTSREFEKKLAEAERGNQNVLFKIDDAYYIADNNGWIKINSDKDVIAINGKKQVTADELNDLIKRKNIKSMSPVDSGNARFEIYAE